MDTDFPSFDPFLREAVCIGRQAGALIKEFYNETGGQIEVTYKKDGSPFTKADIEADLLIHKGLRQLTPDIPIVSEEQPPPFLQNPKGPFWMVDPLDGTKGFIQRSGDFVVNMALIEERRPVFGLIHVPLTGETYVAFENQAYYIKGENIEKLPLHSAPVGKWDAVIGHALLEGDSGDEKVSARFPLRKIHQVGSALKFCSFARGKVHFSWRLTPCYEWDTAAPQAFIEALGGCFTTLDGRPFLYGKPDYLNADGFFVYGAKALQHFTSFS